MRVGRPVRARRAVSGRHTSGVAVAAVLALALSGCNLSPEAPVVAPVGPTAEATALPQESSDAAAQAEADYAEAAERIEELLAEADREPIDTVRGTVAGTDDEFDVQILALRRTELSLVLHLQLLPVGDEPLDLSAVDGGLSGELGEGNRTIADISLLDERSDDTLLPTVYRPDVGEEDPAQRCMCGTLPQIVPPEGVRLTAHYVRAEEGFESVIVAIPGAEQSAPIGNR